MGCKFIKCSDFVANVLEWVDSINNNVLKIERMLQLNHNQFDTVAVAGASHLSQYPLLMSKYLESKVDFIIDNSRSKIGQRLYGTQKIVYSFEHISKIHSLGLILFPSPYIGVMTKQVKSLNNQAIILKANA